MMEQESPNPLPGASLPFLRKIQAQSDAVQKRRADVEERSAGRGCIGHVVAFVGEILGCGKHLQIACEVTPNLQIHRVEAAQGVQVLVVVELVAHEPSLYAQHEPRWIPVASFPGEDIARNLRHSKPQQRNFSRRYRVIDDGCCCELDRKSTRLNSSHLGISYA